MNKVMLIGNVGKEPDVRYFDRDQAVAALPLATTERGYTLQNGTQVPDRTEWHNLVFYRSLAKVVEKFVHKGDKLFVEGKIRTRSYSGQKGEKKYVTEIYVDNMEMLSAKSSSHTLDNSFTSETEQEVGQRMEINKKSSPSVTEQDDSKLPF